MIVAAAASHSAAGQTPATDPPSVLFISVDDLRPELGCYGASHIYSPNIDALAASGRRFERAYCQQAVCNPSRTSLMTGMRPDSTGVVGNHSHFRDQNPHVVTLPQHFKNHGYYAAAIGKIYHGVFPEGSSITKWDTMGDPESWSVPALRFSPRYYYTEEGIAAAKTVFEKIYKPENPGPDDWTSKLVFGLATEAPDVPDNTLYDGKVADAAVNALRTFQDREQPFFLAVGFIKPHSPYIAPKKYFDLYKDPALPVNAEFPTDAPRFAGHNSGELRRYTDQPNSGSIGLANQRRVRQAYFACISYIDGQIGRVLDELERLGLAEDTIVVLWGDHGYHLGEQGLWGKTTNFELDTRVPLIVRTPGMKQAGAASASLVELVDLYPTLAELARLPISGQPITEQLEGTSFVPILHDPQASTKSAALSQYPRGGGLMGYSMRTETHRLTRWVHRPSGEVRATELYDYADGLVETKNIAGATPRIVEKLSVDLESAFDLDLRGDEDSSEATSVGFEPCTPGPFDSLDTPVGKWTPESGRVIIDSKHSKTGTQCLQLTGGENTSVILQIAEDIDTSGMLSFWAERWTSRTPFSFRVDKYTVDGWREIYNGDRTVRVGRAFLSHVKIPLGDARIDRLRFSVTSPPGTGVLVDDLRIAPAAEQRIESVEAVPFTLPALLGSDASALAKLRVVASGQLNPISLTELEVTLEGTPGRADILSVNVLRDSEDWGENGSAPIDADEWRVGRVKTLQTSMELSEGENTIWIVGKVKATADINDRVGVTVRGVTFSDGKTIEIDTATLPQRLGVAVRSSGDDGANTYRIPGLATTNKGTLIGVYDVRWRSSGDLPGDIDVGMSRSVDGGRSWEPMKIIMDMGRDPEWNYDGIGDPAVLVDRNTGTIWVAATWSHGNRSWRGSGPGTAPEETGQLMLVRSDDDGVTWSKPINITHQVKRPEWSFILQGPGKGITMRDGTLVFAAQYQDPPEKNRLPHSTIIYSKDHGETWHVGDGAIDDTTEAQVVEIEPGVLMLNCRYNREPMRVVMTTDDLGQSWKRHTTSQRALIEPGACMASLIDVDREAGVNVGNWLLFANPDSTKGRRRITIKASPDRGMTWPKEHRLLLDEGDGRGYSCMSMIDQHTVGILYESSQADMAFQRIPLGDLIGTTKETSREEPKQSTSNALLQLPRVFGDHMVLQADAEIPIWGSAKADADILVTLGDETRRTIAGNDGKWELRFGPRQATSTVTMITIESEGERREFRDVVIGEVWICTGQSNMEWPLRQSTHGEEELREADHPNLRLLHLLPGAAGSSGSYTSDHLARLTPERFCRGEWKRASANSARDFSAVAWYFGRHLQNELDVPIGLICPAVGGTPTEAWIPREALAKDPKCRGLVAGNWLDNDRLGEFCRTRGEQNLLRGIQAGEAIAGDDLGPNHSFKPGFMWSAGIEPLIPYAIRGAIWYQGESNAETPQRAREHGRLLPLLIEQWRGRWQQGDFPFLYVQLPALDRPHWPAFRDVQRRVVDQVNNVGMAITIDTGNLRNVHPPLKKPVGERLARLALGSTYHRETHSVHCGPLFVTAAREGDSIIVSFRHVGDGLKSSAADPPCHFEIRGDDGTFHPARAEIVSKNAIRVSSPHVAEPNCVRYAWLPFPTPPVNLTNSIGLPASPFSTESEEAVFARKPESPTGDRPNILFIVSEDNSDHLGCYGEHRVHTPHLDALAAGGVRYTRAYVPYSVCSPSRAAFLTGLYTRQNGHIGLATHRFSMFRDFKTMPAYLQQAGYYTGFLGKTHVNPERLVEDYVDHRALPSANFAKTTSIEKYAEQARVVIEKAAEAQKPFLLIINYADAHRKFVGKTKHGFPSVMVDQEIEPYPWIGSDSAHLRTELRDYLNCINRLDEAIGMVLRQLDARNARENTLVVYISDHGADFPRGKGTIYENGTRIPMIVNHSKSFPRGKVESRMVSTIDILPTMLATAGIPVPETLPGLALQDIDAGKVPPRKYIHTFTTGSSPNLLYVQFGIRDDRYKLVFNPDRSLNRLAASRYVNSQLPEDQHVQGFLYPPEYELYDLREDPNEWKNLADSPAHEGIRQRLRTAMKDFQRRINDPLADKDNLAAFINEQKEYQRKPYKIPGFRWPHLEMFEMAQGATRE